jgi:hypothetical protein
LLKGLRVLTSGSEFFYVIENLSVDSVYFFDMGPTKYMTFTDMKYNSVPVIEKKLAPWRSDMDKCG